MDEVMIAFLKLIRLPNLLIIAFTQYMIRFCMMQPILNLTDLHLQMREWQFALLVLATVLISAAGYIINDYFDVRIDSINKPDELVIDKGVKRRVAMGAHAVLSFIGVVIGIYLSWRSNILLSGGTLFAASVIALWFYSTSFKYQFLTGNILISLLTGMVAFLPVFFEIPLIIARYKTTLTLQISNYGFAATTTLLLWGGAYALFAFLLSLIREMIKDMEDVEGDKEYGCRTVPIVLGIQKTKWIVLGLMVLAIAGIAYCQNYLHDQLKENYSALYFLVLIQLPLLFLLFYTFRAKEKKQFHAASIGIKAIMLAGICFLFLLKYKVMH